MRPRCRPFFPANRQVDEGGFILIPVLLTIALLSLVALTISIAAREDVRVSALNSRRAEAQALADGVANLTIRHLVMRATTGGEVFKVTTDGTPLPCRVADGFATIEVFDASGLIDLNSASNEVLTRLFVGAGADNEAAANLAAAVSDFRDYDDITQPGGAEAAEYRAAGANHGPKNAPFSSVDELDQVLGMTPALLARVRPLVTVHSPASNVNLDVASEAVKSLGLPATTGAHIGASTFIIRVGVDGPGAVRFVREAVIGITTRLDAKYIIKQWTALDPGPIKMGIAGIEAASCIEALR